MVLTGPKLEVKMIRVVQFFFNKLSGTDFFGLVFPNGKIHIKII